MSSPDDENRRFTDAALAVSDDCIKIIGLDGTLQYMSEGGRRVMEVDDFSALKGCPWPDFWDQQGNIDATASIEAARAGRVSRFTGFAQTAKGSRRFWDVKVSPIFAEDGSVENILSVSRDITALKEYEQQQALLRSELSHRIKNILTLVQAVANQTLKDGDPMSVAKPVLMNRLAALGRAHDMLMESRHARTTLRQAIELSLRDLPIGNVIIEGPDVEVGSRSGLALALAFHELATNALKYGALSTSSGLLEIVWSVDDKHQLAFIWRETGGPVLSPPTRKGFGSRMIERALASYIQGTAKSEYLPQGLSFFMTAPLSALAED